MANEYTLEVQKRELTNKGSLKKLREEGQVPGIFYSHDSKSSIPFYIERTMLREAHKSGARIFNINVGDKKRTVIFKAVDYHPVTDEVIHIDLYGVKMDQVVNINVELQLTGSAKGIIEGGILVQGLSELEIECLPLDIPEFIEVDVSNLEIGDNIRIGDLTLDEKLLIKTNIEQIVASVTHPMKEEEPVVVEEEEEEFIDEDGAEEESKLEEEKDKTPGEENKEDSKE